VEVEHLNKGIVWEYRRYILYYIYIFFWLFWMTLSLNSASRNVFTMRQWLWIQTLFATFYTGDIVSVQTYFEMCACVCVRVRACVCVLKEWNLLTRGSTKPGRGLMVVIHMICTTHKHTHAHAYASKVCFSNINWRVYCRCAPLNIYSPRVLPLCSHIDAACYYLHVFN